MFLDETGITTNLLRRYGRAPRGARVHDHAPGGRWQTSTVLAAWRVTGLTAPGVFDGAIDGESFRAYIDQILVPILHPGDIVIADQSRGPQGRRLPAGPPGRRGHPLVLTTLQPGPQSHRALLREAQGPRSHRSLSPHRGALAVPRRVLGALQP